MFIIDVSSGPTTHTGRYHKIVLGEVSIFLKDRNPVAISNNKESYILETSVRDNRYVEHVWLADGRNYTVIPYHTMILHLNRMLYEQAERIITDKVNLEMDT